MPPAWGRISLPYVGFGAVFLDFDNDADQDLFVANGHVYPQIERPGSGATYAQANHLFANDAGHFRLVELAPSEHWAVSRGAVAGDFDDDGRLDLFVTNLNGRPSLLHNQTAAGHHWLGLRLVGVGKKPRGGRREGRIVERRSKAAAGRALRRELLGQRRTGACILAWAQRAERIRCTSTGRVV